MEINVRFSFRDCRGASWEGKGLFHFVAQDCVIPLIQHLIEAEHEAAGLVEQDFGEQEVERNKANGSSKKPSCANYLLRTRSW